MFGEENVGLGNYTTDSVWLWTYALDAVGSLDSTAAAAGDFNDSATTSRRMITLKYPREANVFAAVCSILFTVVGVPGNLLTIVALGRWAKLRNATTAFVISLCTADLIFCAFNLPLTASRFIHEEWVLGDTLCKLFPFFFYGNVAASLLSMTAITINRYILINHYRIYDAIYQKKYIAVMILFCWAFSFAMLLPAMFKVWGQFGYHPETFSCTILKYKGRSPKKFLFVFGFLLPCVVIITSYSCIFLKVHRSRQNVTAHNAASPGSRSLSQRADELRLTRLMLIIFCSFLICFLPLMVVNVFDSRITYPAVHVLASVLAWLSSVVNPIIYAALNRQYRYAYLRLCGLVTRRDLSLASSMSRSGSGGYQKTLVSDVFVFHPQSSRGHFQKKPRPDSAIA